jgi:predicted NBD/HSP70 family sugar kinase
VSTAVRRLIDDGLVLEVGRAESTGGKPRVLLQLNADAYYALGVHLDHGAITYALTDLAGAPISGMTRPGAGQVTPRTVVERMSHEVTELITQAQVDRERVLGIGLVSPGPLTSQTGMHLTPPFMRSWEDYPLDSELSRLSGFPVLLENDATAAAIGEYWTGGTEREGSFAALYMSTGIGAGILLSGSPHRGASGNAGEIGHISANVTGPKCWCGARGCIESYGGPAALVTRARERGLLPGIATGLDAALDTVAVDQTSIAEQFATLAQLSRSGDAAATELLEESIPYIAHAAHILANTLDLRLLMLSGTSFGAASHIYLPAIREALDNSFFARDNHPVEVRVSQSADTAAAIGGAALVLQSEFVPERSSTLASKVRKTEDVSEHPAP